MKDLIIIGGGPAGITAAVYAARKKIDFSIITRDIGGQASWAANVENYTGYQFIPGSELIEKFMQHLNLYKFDLQEGVEATKVEKKENYFIVHSSGKEPQSAKTLIIASGKSPRLLNVPGELEYRNKGVSYCSTCDGPVFAGKKVAVVGGGNSALDSLIQMSRIASHVYSININDKYSGDKIIVDKVEKLPNIEILNNTKTLGISGDNFVKGLRIEREGGLKEIPVEGVFIEIGSVPSTAYIDCLEKNEIGEIRINCFAETSCPGIYACGDVTHVPDKQIIIAAGDGAKAALGAFRYLARLI